MKKKNLRSTDTKTCIDTFPFTGKLSSIIPLNAEY